MCGLKQENPPMVLNSRRRRLWELSTKCYCPLIGVCFDVNELRRMLKQLVQLPAAANDYEVHVAAVQLCGKRNSFSETLQRDLDRRHALEIKHFRAAKTAEQLLALWQDALNSPRVRGALWAIWTHPRCHELLTQQIYADIHMLQHQLGCLQRHEHAHVERVQSENLALTQDLAQMQQRFTRFRDEKTQEIVRLQQKLAEQEALACKYQAANEKLEHTLTELKDVAIKQQTLSTIQHRLTQAETRTRLQQVQIETLERQLHNAEIRASTQNALPDNPQSLEEELCQIQLEGRCVLCVGGRASAIEHYRELVERLGGRFIHHDGGVEENFHRLESTLSSADAVICQAGCINHRAYWQVKDYCKKTGKTCIYARTPSLNAFDIALREIAAE